MTGTLYRLTRPPLALLNGTTAVAGYLLLPAPPAAGVMLALLVGVSLLACGATALNQVLERDVDRLMLRTMPRPLPRGDLSPWAATAIAAPLLLAGQFLLGAAGGAMPVLLGAMAVIWYLAIYTPLKRRTPLALAAGAICGAIPPVMGWCTGGGSPLDPRALLLAGLLFLWQIPHFWLFQRRHAEDYCRAGLPLAPFSRQGAAPACVWRLWIAALAAATLLLPAFGIIAHHAGLWTMAVVAPLLVVCCSRRETLLFPCLNLFPPVMTLALLAQV
jgi:protoheme IX farnesyltransferase